MIKSTKLHYEGSTQHHVPQVTNRPLSINPQNMPERKLQANLAKTGSPPNGMWL